MSSTPHTIGEPDPAGRSGTSGTPHATGASGSAASSSPLAPLAYGRLEERFADKLPSYRAGEARAEADRCLYCFDAPCTHACPTAIDVPKFIKRIATGDILGSARTILESNLLGYSCGRVCPVEVLCVGACVYNHRDQPPIQIGRLQRYAVETALASGRPILKAKQIRSGKVALVGAGPASLSCAGVLALCGVETVIYESKPWPGGLNTTGVAPYKMPAPDALAEVEFLRSLGVRIETGVRVGVDIEVERLLQEYDAIFLGLGLGSDRRLGIPGEEGEGVIGAVAFIERLKLDPSLRSLVQRPKHDPGVAVHGIQPTADPAAARQLAEPDGDFISNVVVIGGGNTAIDAARELAQLGAASVSLVYRRAASEMPAYAHEVEAARIEGVRLIDHAVPLEVIRENGRVTALRIERRPAAPAREPAGELRTPRSARRANPPQGDALSANVQSLPADLIVVAIGQDRLAASGALFPGVEVDARGRIVVDERGRTGHPKIFAGGDCTNGGKEVVNAVADGKLAAASILEQLEQRETVRGHRG